MLKDFNKKLEFISSLAPTAENEETIRRSSHELINEIRLFQKGEPNDNSEKIIRQCYLHIETLNRRLIMSKSKESCVFTENDLEYTAANCVIACDTLLSTSESILTFSTKAKAKCVFAVELLTQAVILITEALIPKDSGASVEFRVERLPRSTVLFAHCEFYKSGASLSDSFKENIAVLTKIANLHSGACVWQSAKSGAYIALSISKDIAPNGKSRKPPSYIDLLLDRTSQVYIGLSRLENLYPHS